MGNYIIKKVLNNNVVVAMKNKEEIIIVGKGIGFDIGKGGIIPQERIENIFIKETNTTKENYDKILKSIDEEIIGICEEIISFSEKTLNTKLNEAIHVSLPDHINFAITRIAKGIKIENPFLKELIALYPEEYNIAKIALTMINERFSVNLPEDEIGFICLHIRASIAQQDLGTSITYTKKIGEIMELISKLLKKDFDKNSLDYARTITHINFMIQRLIDKKPIKNYLLDSIKKELFHEYDIAIKVAMKIEGLFSIKVTEDEIGYIALHLKRLSEF